MTTYKKSALTLLMIIILFEVTVAFIGNIADRPGWGDEVRFHETIIKFGDSITLDKLKQYHQMSTPLPFIIYAYWGRLFGFDLFPLRILSIILAILTYMMFHRILYETTGNNKLSFLGTLFLVVHPYMVGLSIFVFTDMPAILSLLISYWGLRNNRYLIFTIFLTLSILSRQYMLFIIPAIIVYDFMNWIKNKKISDFKTTLASFIATIPYLLLILFWGGTSPDNDLRQLYLTDGFFFKFNVLFLYIALLFVYLLPYYFFTWRRFYKDKIILGLSLLISFLYFLFPVTPSKYSVDIGVLTVGLFHKGLVYLFNSNTIIQIIFYISVLLGLPILLTFIKESYEHIKQKKLDSNLQLDLIIIFFFIVLPFSYLGWEKYFMPLLPFVIIKLSLIIKERTNPLPS